MSKTTRCFSCNKAFITESEEDMYTCKNYSMTTLLPLCNTKVLRQIVLKIFENISTYVIFNNGLLSFLANTLCTELTLSQPDVKPLKTLYLNLVTKRWLLTRQAISFASSHQPSEKKNLNIHHTFWQALDTNSSIFRNNLLVFFPFIVICVVNKYNEPHGCRKILGETFI